MSVRVLIGGKLPETSRGHRMRGLTFRLGSIKTITRLSTLCPTVILGSVDSVGAKRQVIPERFPRFPQTSPDSSCQSDILLPKSYLLPVPGPVSGGVPSRGYFKIPRFLIAQINTCRPDVAKCGQPLLRVALLYIISSKKPLPNDENKVRSQHTSCSQLTYLRTTRYAPGKSPNRLIYFINNTVSRYSQYPVLECNYFTIYLTISYLRTVERACGLHVWGLLTRNTQVTHFPYFKQWSTSTLRQENNVVKRQVLN